MKALGPWGGGLADIECVSHGLIFIVGDLVSGMDRDVRALRDTGGQKVLVSRSEIVTGRRICVNGRAVREKISINSSWSISGLTDLRLLIMHEVHSYVSMG
ncbi:hypothetical protein AAMO2058_001153600 [Amorphochlora amoebiformis]|eukprot:1227173-Amorphochlora_amoeboformis.AAC.2